MITIQIEEWQFYVIIGLCIFPLINKILEWSIENLRKENNETILQITKKIDNLHK